MKELENLLIRIKTEEEFKKEFGEDWDNKVRGGWCSDMDFFFNGIIPEEHKLEYFKVIIGVQDYTKAPGVDRDGYYGWLFSIDMIKYEYREQTTI
jgi:hypothetical protein